MTTIAQLQLHEQLLDLVEQGLVIAKRHPEKPWTLFKYHNKVFYNNLWHTSPALSEARGIVISDDSEIIQRPFHKCFNVGENGVEAPEKGYHDSYRKVNGFMAAASWVYDNLIVTTTGSFGSDYQSMAYDAVVGGMKNFRLKGVTFLFEVCHENDPHIVEEAAGAYLLSARIKDSGMYASQDWCNNVAFSMGGGIKRPEKESYDINAKHEGFMFYDHDGTPLAKAKTPHYLSKKALMRLGKGAVRGMFDNPVSFRQRLDEEFYGILDTILTSFNPEGWLQLGEQGRRMWIENYFNSMEGV